MFKKNKIFSLLLVAVLFLFFGGLITSLAALNVGQTVGSIKIINPNDNPAWIPYIGKKVVTIMYTDPDEKDVNDPLSDAIKAKDYSKEKYSGIGIANCKDTWMPNAAIRVAARKKQAQFKDSVILLDEDKSVSTQWNLGNCDGMGVVIVIGKDKKVKYIKKVANQGQSRAIISEVLKILDEEIAK